MQNYKKISTFAPNIELIARKMKEFIKHYPLTILITVVIWVLCFINIPETPLDNVSFIDKWTHMAMYLALGLIVALETFRDGMPRSLRNIFITVWTLPVAMGGLIEILQAYCTGGRRNGDWIDWLADIVGSTVALVLTLMVAYARRWRK